MLLDGLHLRMGDIVPAGEQSRTAEDHIFLAGNKVFLDPRESFEPDQFDPARFIVKLGCNTDGTPVLLHFRHLPQPSADLHVGIGFADLGHGIVPGLVYITVGKKIEQVARIEQSHLGPKGQSAPGTYTSQVFDRG